MQVKIFPIRLEANDLEIDQNSLNDFLETVMFIKSDTHYVETENSYWSVLVHFEEKTFQHSEPKANSQMQPSDLNEIEQNIFDHLKKWRSEKAVQLDLKHFMICHNSELIEIAIKKPNSISQLRLIKGFGSIKSDKFGAEIISLLNAV